MTGRHPGWARALFLAAGLACLALALAGVFLPLLPTTPFLLLAAACFARSSDRLHRWLLDHRRFGPLLQDWEAGGAIRPSAKRAATAAILAGAALTLAFSHLSFLARCGFLATLAGALAFIWSRPDGPPPGPGAGPSAPVPPHSP